MEANLKYIPLSKIIASVKNDFSSFDDAGLIDESRIIKTIMLCNEKLGIPIHNRRECFVPVRNYKVDLPPDFWKVIYVCAVEQSSFGISNYRDPFNNTVTLDMKCKANYEASLEVIVEGCTKNCPTKIIKRDKGVIMNTYTTWIPLTLSKKSDPYVHNLCFNKNGKYTIDIEEEVIELPFREGELYMMYFSALEDENGEVLVPFHPLISNWYEWCIKEKILEDIMFNSDGQVVDKLQRATRQKALYWLDAINFVNEPFYKELKGIQHRKELKFYNDYYKHIM